MFKHLLEQTSKSLSNTDGRTDGLTKMVVYFRGDMTLSHAREEREEVRCICIDERESCPPNCFIRWTST